MSDHYTKDENGRDYLARCERALSPAEMQGAYLFTIGKYLDRAGKKPGEDVAKEMGKVIDYGSRALAWSESVGGLPCFEARIKLAIKRAEERLG